MSSNWGGSLTGTKKEEEDKETRQQATKSDKHWRGGSVIKAPGTISVLPPPSDSPTEEKMS